MEKKNNILIERMGESWYNQLSSYLESPEFDQIGQYLAMQRQKTEVYPNKEDIFKALKLTPFDQVKVVFIGQDPYARKAEALGISFGINQHGLNYIPPSLQNIRKEMEDDLGVLLLNFDYSLEHWCAQGVLMLNAALTVERGNPGCHVKLWENFTKQVFHKLCDQKTGLIFILLGKQAQIYKKYINTSLHYIIEAPHPAAESYSGNKAGFFGSKIFSKTNNLLIGQNGKNNAINWTGMEDYKIEWKENDEPF